MNIFDFGCIFLQLGLCQSCNYHHAFCTLGLSLQNIFDFNCICLQLGLNNNIILHLGAIASVSAEKDFDSSTFKEADDDDDAYEVDYNDDNNDDGFIIIIMH